MFGWPYKSEWMEVGMSCATRRMSVKNLEVETTSCPTYLETSFVCTFSSSFLRSMVFSACECMGICESSHGCCVWALCHVLSALSSFSHELQQHPQRFTMMPSVQVCCFLIHSKCNIYAYERVGIALCVVPQAIRSRRLSSLTSTYTQGTQDHDIQDPSKSSTT